MPTWNPWHGCHKISEGCRHCYVYREDAAFGNPVPSSEVRKTASFELPLRLNRKKEWKYPSGTTFALCMTSDFLVEEADAWRERIWEIIRLRSDCRFFFFTKRIVRLQECLPADWGEGYDNVGIGCTVENARQAALRLPLFLSLPIRHRLIIAAPLLGPIDMTTWLDPDLIEEVSAGGESGRYARTLDFNWVLDLSRQCLEAGVPFSFHQTGSYISKDGRVYRIPRELQHSQALKAGLNTN